jgi:hypothetical protein
MSAKEFNIRGYKKEVNLIKTQQFIDKTKSSNIAVNIVQKDVSTLRFF